MITFFYVALGGALGSGIRYLFNSKIHSQNFPYATLTVNVLGCFIMGIATGYFLKNTSVDQNLRLFVTTGFLGGFTTFSAFSLDAINLINKTEYSTAFIYILLNVVLSLLSLFFGLYLISVSKVL